MMKSLETLKEAHELRESGRESPKWIPLAAAILAVLSAVSGFLSNVRSTAALVAKNDVIVARTRASDVYNEYEAGRIKFYVYQSAIDAGNAGHNAANLRAMTAREAAKGPPLLAKAHGFEAQATHENDRSERLLQSHEIIEVGTTLFEMAIVLVSIAAVAGSRLLPLAAAAAAVTGVGFFIAGVLR